MATSEKVTDLIAYKSKKALDAVQELAEATEWQVPDVQVKDEKLRKMIINRVRDIEDLVRMRSDQGVGFDDPEDMLYIYGCHVAQVYPWRAINHKICALGYELPRFTEGMEVEVISQVWQNIELLGRMPKWRTDTIINRLGITESEQKHMRTLRGYAPKKSGLTKWHYMTWEEKFEVLAEAERNNPGASKKQLAEAIGITPGTLRMWYRRRNEREES